MYFKHRGMFLETIINQTIEYYQINEIAFFNKNFPVVKFWETQNFDHQKILKKAFLYQKGRVDYYGVYRGRFVAFEAKSTNLNYLPLHNIQSHQQKYLLTIIKHGGIGFYIFCFKTNNLFFLLDARKINLIKKRHISLEFLQKKGYSIKLEYPGILDFVLILKNQKNL